MPSSGRESPILGTFKEGRFTVRTWPDEGQERG